MPQRRALLTAAMMTLLAPGVFRGALSSQKACASSKVSLEKRAAALSRIRLIYKGQVSPETEATLANMLTAEEYGRGDHGGESSCPASDGGDDEDAAVRRYEDAGIIRSSHVSPNASPRRSPFTESVVSPGAEVANRRSPYVSATQARLDRAADEA
ncbi:unnamed protein product, partial [Phaeothamnion confervicola]